MASTVGPYFTTRRRVAFAVGLVLVLGALLGWVVGKMLIGVVGGLVAWMLTDGLYRRLARATRGRRGLAAGLTVAATVLLVVLPTALIVYLAVLDASNLVDSAKAWLEPYRPEIERRVTQLTRGGSTRLFGVRVRLEDLTAQVEQGWTTFGAVVLALTRRVTGGLLEAGLLLGTILYAQFYFCLDGTRFLAWLRDALPLDEEHGQGLIEEFLGASRSTLKAFVVLGSLQGALGGLAFWALGIPAPLFWGVLMALTSAIPSVGAQLVLFPAALVLMFIGRIGAGVGLLAFSWIVIASVDNLLRPVLVRRDAQLHELLVFVSSIGGIATFGLVGVFLGPVLAALFKASVGIYLQVRRLPRQPG